MVIMKKYIWIILIIVLLALASSFYFLTKSSYQFEILPSDNIASWDFSASHKDGGELELMVEDNIKRLKGLFGAENVSDYILYVSLANEHSLLGDGKKTYKYLNKALEIDSEITGLAWNNMGQLMTKLGAYESARVAFSNAIEAQATTSYYMSKLSLLKAYFPEEKEEIKDISEKLGMTYEEQQF
jgi:tetratricopeptide (TPR) repeat protein